MCVKDAAYELDLRRPDAGGHCTLSSQDGLDTQTDLPSGQ